MIHELTTETTPLAELRTYHRNPRQGDTSAIAKSLRVNGQYRPVVVNRGTHTGRANEVLAGNHTMKAARDEGWSEMACSYVDVDDDQAARIVAADNRTADLGSYDDRLLAELLSELDDLEGTGYDPGDLDKLLAELGDDAEGLGEGPAESDGTTPGESGELWGSTIGDPDLMPEKHSVWRVGNHHLVIADVNKEHAHFVPYLGAESLLYPYPSLLSPYNEKAAEAHVVMVQPSPFLAGWLLTKYNRLHPNEPAREVTP